MPHQTPGPFNIQTAVDHPAHSPGLVLGQDIFVQLLILFRKDDEVFEQIKDAPWITKTLDLGL